MCRGIVKTSNPHTPNGWLQAFEFAEKGKGTVEADGRNILYTDGETNIVTMESRFASVREARSQLMFYRDRYHELKERRAAIRLVS